jgi:hypothetical protein
LLNCGYEIGADIVEHDVVTGPRHRESKNSSHRARANNSYFHSVLAWSDSEFERRLRDDSRLMIIGYGFNDQRINETILRLAKSGTLHMFIIDPRVSMLPPMRIGDHDSTGVCARRGASGLSGPLGIWVG